MFLIKQKSIDYCWKIKSMKKYKHTHSMVSIFDRYNIKVESNYGITTTNAIHFFRARISVDRSTLHHGSVPRGTFLGNTASFPSIFCCVSKVILPSSQSPRYFEMLTKASHFGFS